MGGGVLLIVNNNVQSTRIRDMEPSGYEVLVCDAKPRGKKTIRNYSSLRSSNDFNMPGIDWSCPAPKYPSYVNNFC